MLEQFWQEQASLLCSAASLYAVRRCEQNVRALRRVEENGLEAAVVVTHFLYKVL